VEGAKEGVIKKKAKLVKYSLWKMSKFRKKIIQNIGGGERKTKSHRAILQERGKVQKFSTRKGPGINKPGNLKRYNLRGKKKEKEIKKLKINGGLKQGEVVTK